MLSSQKIASAPDRGRHTLGYFSVQRRFSRRAALRRVCRQRMWTSEGRPIIRRGASFDISLLTFTVHGFDIDPCSSASSPGSCSCKWPSAVATRSVGDKDSHFPLLAVGASVVEFFCEGPFTALQWRSAGGSWRFDHGCHRVTCIAESTKPSWMHPAPQQRRWTSQSSHKLQTKSGVPVSTR